MASPLVEAAVEAVELDAYLMAKASINPLT